MTWQYACDITHKTEQPSVMIKEEMSPRKGSLKTVLLVAWAALATLLLFFLLPGVFPGNAGGPSSGGNPPNLGPLESRLATLDQKLAEYERRLAAVEKMEQHVVKINHDIEVFRNYYLGVEEARDESFGRLNRRIDDLGKMMGATNAEDADVKKTASPSASPGDTRTAENVKQAPLPEKKDSPAPVSNTASAVSDTRDIASSPNGTAIPDRSAPATESAPPSNRSLMREGTSDLSGKAPAAHIKTPKAPGTVSKGDKADTSRSKSAVKKISKKTPPKKRITRYHKVKSGETLFRIGKRYNLTVTRIMKMNNLKNGAIYIGQRLKVGTAVTR